MYDVENVPLFFENAAGFARLDTYIYSLITKWQHWGTVQNECMVQDHVDIISCSCSNIESD